MTEIKLCGLFRFPDVLAANAAQSDYAGFVFARSRRQIDLLTALSFRRMLDPKIKSVGVFVDTPLAEMLRILKSGAISIIQLHGNQSEETVMQIQRAGGKVIRVFNMNERAYEPTAADAVMFDGGRGEGKTFDWSRLPRQLQQKVFLAGGLTLDNIPQAIEQAHPDVIDLSSGIETAGLKDANKMKKAVMLAHAAK